MTKKLKIGDVVLWRGCWGTEAPLPVVVRSIDEVEPGLKDGHPVEEMDWSDVELGRAVVSLDNGHWAYGHQIDPR